MKRYGVFILAIALGGCVSASKFKAQQAQTRSETERAGAAAAGVDPGRLIAAGYGEWRPLAPNDTPENKALNRRIEIVLIPRD